LYHFMLIEYNDNIANGELLDGDCTSLKEHKKKRRHLASSILV
jgi:hypothetical protein